MIALAPNRKHTRSDATLQEQFDGMRADYAAAKQNRFRRRRTGVTALGSGADYHYRSEADFFRVMEYARDMDRNDAVVGQLTEGAVTNMVQDGIHPDPQTGDAGLDAELTARWEDWSQAEDDCDTSGELTFDEMSFLVKLQELTDGDIMALPNRDSGAVELVEAHRCRTPTNTRRNMVHGVELNELRRHVRYWFTKQEIGLRESVKKVGDMSSYDTRDKDGHRQVFHVYDKRRASQTRGVTAYAPCFDLAGMFEDTMFARMVQQQVVSCFAVFRQREESFGNSKTGQRGAKTIETEKDGTTRTLEGISPGMEVRGAKGEKLTGFSPAVPNPEFFPFIELILSLIGANIGMPMVLVLMDASKTNFSGWRGAVEQAKLGFKRGQKNLIRRFIRPTYLWKLRQWSMPGSDLHKYAKGNRKTETIRLERHRYTPPSWPYIEPLKDATADSLQTRDKINSPRRIQRNRSRDWADVSTEIVEDQALAIEKSIQMAEELNKKYPNSPHPVSRFELYTPPSSEGMNVVISDSDNANNDNQPPNNETNDEQQSHHGNGNGKPVHRLV